MRILKTILLIILIIFLAITGRKLVIISSLNNKLSNYTNSTNYYIKAINYSGETSTICENYVKDEKYVTSLQFISETLNNVVCIDYYNGKTVNTYREIIQDDGTVLREIMNKDQKDNISFPIVPNAIKIEHPFNFILKSLFSTVKSVECNGKDCYQVTQQWFNDNSESIYYIDKETGLTVRTIGDRKIRDENGNQYDLVSDYQYEFDVVTDNDLIEPDINVQAVDDIHLGG